MHGFHTRPNKQADGFALVVTLSLMILLTVIAIGLLSLSTVSLRTSSQGRALSEARANARLALMLAMGELQKQAGPDQRITAPAAILDATPETEAIDNVGEAQVAGVWESNKQAIGQAPSLPNYDKSGTFRRWLVSGLDEAVARQSTGLTQSPFRNSARGVRLIGENTTEDRDESSPSHLWAGKVDLNGQGHGAYVVIDEGAKARINLASPTTTSPALLSRGNAGAPPRHAFDLVQKNQSGQAIPLDSYYEVRQELNKAITLDSTPLLKSDLPKLGPYFQDFTTDSAGVLADVSLGGLRKDLSLFGELDALPSDYQKRRIYSDTDTPFASSPKSNGYNAGSPDPYWSLIHDHLNIDKRVTGAAGNNLPAVTITSTVPSGYKPGTGSGDTFKINRDAQARYPLAPVIVRCELMFSFFAKEAKGHQPWEWEVPNSFGGGSEGGKWNHMLHLIYTPLVTLWNPYNVSLKLRQPVVEIANPPVAFRFIRQKSSAVSAIGEVTDRLVPLDEMYLNGDQKFDKKFVMQLFGQVSSSGTTSGDVVLLPGEVKLFSPALDPSANFATVFDWQNNLTDRSNYAPQIRAAPGWRGPQYGFNIDWLAGEPGYVPNKRNGTAYNIGVIGSRIDDIWDVECGLALPRRKDRSNIKRYSVSLLTSTGATSPASSSNVISRLEFDYDANLATLTKALTPGGSGAANFPFKMSSYSNPEKASNIRVSFNDPIKNWIVKPFMVLTAQAKSNKDAEFPGRPWVHNNSTRPVSYQFLKDDHQAGNSHELSLFRYKNGMATDAKIDVHNRGYAFGGANSLHGSSFYIHRELALTPVQSQAQLSHFDLATSPFPGSTDHPVGSSFAHPMVKSGEYQSGPAVDHAWLANFRLWDSWYASTFSNPRPYWPSATELKSQITAFAANTQTLSNPRFAPWTSGRSPAKVADLLTKSGTEPQDDAFLKSASTQLLQGAFNVNSTSKAAWMSLLGGLDRETISSLVFNGSNLSIAPDGLTTKGPYLTRRRMPATSSAPANTANQERFAFWNDGCDLTRDELDALASGIVREVKRRGPFLSLAEFVNRRIGPESDLTLKGAIQAAIDDAPGIGDLNANSQGKRKDRFAELSRNITNAETKNVPYLYPQAALGHAATGASGSLDQLAVLNQIGATISARSDTFRIRAYGDATDPDGQVLARAWCEAIVQRVPEYVVDKAQDGNDPWDSSATPLQTVNRSFGRRFTLRSFRWLSENEI
ncbi:MAG: hypothetical protein EAZ65_01835 [Verrucomicrobia bacterium]|nr:MAG: hypothetical protein EAZ84_11065 [Verrucomicrobiota bacterium]TAE89064.1 MAG: hypothetical protein EAZ82_00065 [Verrucomicrobiota bacterium]TAF28064.1 MAG: hypothetical protein EAZ71_01840 [Verrucomicrobiota bacterium]TAF42911.1 MAG: hypothetical protein EAZ65_01835 [Verrucomicrobiota bacterium]